MDNPFAIIKRFAKGQVDYWRTNLRLALFGGGGVKIPEYRNISDKPVLNDPIKIGKFLDYYLQAVSPYRTTRMYNFA